MNELIAQILRSTVELIDTISPRGALRGEELLNVGMLRQRTIEVLQAAEAEAKRAAEAEAEAANAAAEAEAAAASKKSEK